MKVLNQQLIKNNNLKQIYTIVSENEGISRANIATITGLSKTTVSALIEELLEGGYLVDEGAANVSCQGRKPNSLKVNGEENVIAAIHWHTKRLHLGFVGLDGSMNHFRRQMLTDNTDYVEQIVSAYNNLKNSLSRQEKRPRILGLCFLVPGMVDSVNERLVTSILPLHPNTWVLKRLRAAIADVPMAFFNDTACFAYAEKIQHGIDHRPSAFVNLSGGVGAVLFHSGEMLRGANGMTTQFGHLSIERNGALCQCGNRGCLEGRIGEKVLTERAKAFLSPEVLLRAGEIDYEKIGMWADMGHKEYQSFADAIADDLAYALGNLISVYHVKRVIIGGRGRNLGNYFMTVLQRKVKVTGFREFVSACEVKYSRVAEHGGFEGAARYFMDQHYQFLEDMSGKLILR